MTSFSYPSRHAHPIHGLEMARAWSDLLGNSFTFVIEGTSDEKLFEGIQYRCAFGGWGNLIKALHARTVAYFFWLLFFCMRSGRGRSVIFANDIRIGMAAALLRRVFNFTFIFESHGLYPHRAEKLVYSCADRIVFVTDALRTRAIAVYPAVADKSIVARNAVDLSRYTSISKTKEQLRADLSLQSGIVIGYVGRFAPGGIDKGVPFMLRALPHLPSAYRMLFVGGTKDEIAAMEKLAGELGIAERATFVPFVEPSLVAAHEMACDMLAYVPENAGSTFQSIETSPMKLFEYMAARRPIVVADTPAVREILDDSCAYFIRADSSGEFATAVQRIADHTHEAAIRSQAAFERVRENSWRRRALRIAALYG